MPNFLSFLTSTVCLAFFRSWWLLWDQERYLLMWVQSNLYLSHTYVSCCWLLLPPPPSIISLTFSALRERLFSWHQDTTSAPCLCYAVTFSPIIIPLTVICKLCHAGIILGWYTVIDEEGVSSGFFGILALTVLMSHGLCPALTDWDLFVSTRLQRKGVSPRVRSFLGAWMVWPYCQMSNHSH